MPRSEKSRGILVKWGKEKRKLPAHLMKKVTATSPQLVLPALGQTMDIEDKKQNKFRMIVTERPSWVNEGNLGSYQVKVKWLDTEHTASWNKVTRKWTLNSIIQNRKEVTPPFP